MMIVRESIERFEVLSICLNLFVVLEDVFDDFVYEFEVYVYENIVEIRMLFRFRKII